MHRNFIIISIEREKAIGSVEPKIMTNSSSRGGRRIDRTDSNVIRAIYTKLISQHYIRVKGKAFPVKLGVRKGFQFSFIQEYCLQS